MSTLTTAPLSAATWDPYAALIARHGGVWGGCRCMGFHAKGAGWGVSADLNRAEKRARVHNGTAHAALVFDGDTCVGWCQFGSADELPRIKHRKAYEGNGQTAPDWRITCFFVDKTARGKGIAATGLAFALTEIARLGGGRVEAMAEDTTGRKVSGSFLHGGSVAMFQAEGFAAERKLGKHIWLMRKSVDPANWQPPSPFVSNSPIAGSDMG